MFFLLIAKIIPPTSIVVPLISKYLLFTFIMNILSVLNTCIVINLYYKRVSLDQVHPWTNIFFFKIMPRVLFLNRNKQATAAATRERIASLSLSANFAANHHLQNSKLFNLSQAHLLSQAIQFDSLSRKAMNEIDKNPKQVDLEKKATKRTLSFDSNNDLILVSSGPEAEIIRNKLK